mgnify:CR=1 FL=1
MNDPKETIEDSTENSKISIDNTTETKDLKANTKTKKKAPMWQWLVLIILLVGLAGFIASTPMFNQYSPRTGSSTSSTSTTQYSSNQSSRITKELSTSSNSDSSQYTLNKAYWGLTQFLPVTLTVTAIMIFIGLCVLIMISADIRGTRNTIDDLYDLMNNKK